MRTVEIMSLGVALVLCAPGAGAQCPAYWTGESKYPGVGGHVYSLELWDPDGDGPLPEVLLAGGSLAGVKGWAAGTQTPVASWDGSAWKDLGYNMTGTVRALAMFQGKLYAAGLMYFDGSSTSYPIAVLNGATWSPIAPAMNNAYTGYALCVHNDELVAGGVFTSLGPANTQFVGRYNGSAWSAMAGGLSGTIPTSGTLGVHALASYGGHLVAGGSFVQSGATPMQCLSRWDGAAWSAVGTGTCDGPVHTLLADGEDLYVGGVFSQIGGVTSKNIARWNGGAMVAMGFTSGQGSGVYALAKPHGVLCAAGYYNGPYWWDGAAWALGPQYIRGNTTGNEIAALREFQGQLVAGGFFDWAYGPAQYTYWTIRNIARLDADRWMPLGRGISDPVEGFVEFRGEPYAFGQFRFVNDHPAAKVARLTDGAWEGIGSDIVGTVWCAAEFNAVLLLGGTISRVEGSTCQNLVAWDGVQLRPFAPGLGSSSSSIGAMRVYKGDLYAGGGDFYVPNSPYAQVIVRLVAEMSNWQALASGLSGGGVKDFEEFEGDLIAGGSFQNAGAITARGIARWNGSTWTPMNGSLAQFSTCYDLQLHDGLLYAAIHPGGSSDSGSYVYRWTGSTWEQLLPGLYWTRALASYHGRLLALGDYGVRAWNGAGWDTVAGTTVSGGWLASIEHRGELHVGGDALYAGPINSPYLARYTEPAAPGLEQGPSDAIVCSGGEVVLSLSATGTPPPTFAWRRGGAALQDGVTSSGSIISGAGSDTLRIQNAGPQDAGLYTCDLSNGCGVASAGPAQVSVCVADVDCNTYVNGDDIDAFLDAFDSGDASADVDRNGYVNGDDFDSFSAAVDAGC